MRGGASTCYCRALPLRVQDGTLHIFTIIIITLSSRTSESGPSVPGQYLGSERCQPAMAQGVSSLVTEHLRPVNHKG